MTAVANRRLYHDILPYTRRMPQYDRSRGAIPRQPEQKQVQDVVKPGVRSIDGIHSGKTRTIPVVQPKSFSAAPQKVTVTRTGDKSVRHIDMVVSKRIVHMPVVMPKQQTAPVNPVNPIAQQFEPQQEQTYVEPEPKASFRSRFLQVLPIGLALMMLIAGSGVFFWTVKTNKQVVAQVQAAASEAAEDIEAAPEEDEVSASAVGSYRTAPDVPRTLTIDKINVFSRIQRLGTLRSGALAAPKNVHDAGWYEGSSKPGDGGAVLIVGHVYGPSKPGVFKNLHKLEAGDTVKVTRGDGQEFQYRVVKKEQVPADQVDMAAALVPVTPGKAGLNIITCAGELIPGTTHYADRIVVYAEQI